MSERKVAFDDGWLNTCEKEVVDIIVAHTGGDVAKVLGFLHLLAAKVATLGDITTDSLLTGQARQVAVLHGKN